MYMLQRVRKRAVSVLWIQRVFHCELPVASPENFSNIANRRVSASIVNRSVDVLNLLEINSNFLIREKTLSWVNLSIYRFIYSIVIFVILFVTFCTFVRYNYHDSFYILVLNIKSCIRFNTRLVTQSSFHITSLPTKLNKN